MTTTVWDSWVEINPATAAGLGISQGDLVEVASPQGALRLPAVIYPGIRPDMVAIPMGQGQTGGGRYAKGRGVNPLALLGWQRRHGAATGLECHQGAADSHFGKRWTGDGRPSAGKLPQRSDRDLDDNPYATERTETEKS